MDGQTQQPETNVAVSTMVNGEPFRAPDAVGSPAPAKPDFDQLVEAWFRQHFHGLGARLDESLYNHVHAAKDDLKRLLQHAE